MNFNPLKWKTRNVKYATITIFTVYVLFIFKKSKEVVYEGIIENSNPIHVWEYIADFSNMKHLNPTIEEFNIIAESGNYDNWKYSVQYKEHLSHLPMIHHTAHGHYTVKRENEDYLIISQHRTCFFLNFGCLNSLSQFTFTKSGDKDTKYIETVQYECPITAMWLCNREVIYQRTEILKRLKSVFSKAS